MAEHQFIRVFIIATQHRLQRVLGNEFPQRIEIAGGGAFTNGDETAVGDFVERFILGETFVIGGDPRRQILAC